MTRVISVRGIVLHNNKLLCARLKPYKGSLSRSNDFWCLPGGGLDDGEPLTAGVAREMLEETGIAPVVGNLLYIQQFADGGREFLEFFFHITNGADYLRIDLSKSTHGQEELEEIAFVDPAATFILPTFLSTENLAGAAGSNGPPRIFSLF